jgi:hypothetical protein
MSEYARGGPVAVRVMLSLPRAQVAFGGEFRVHPSLRMRPGTVCIANDHLTYITTKGIAVRRFVGGGVVAPDAPMATLSS